ncbi:MAG TPA: hypothetical protein VK524_11860, partial [Polyangiaceae bacterium]|nr:hypothetical protein [Polyangiaceae bacterium]
MTVVPETPHDFFTKYVPARFEAVKAGVAGQSSVGSLTFRVGDSEWSMRLRGGELAVSPGMTEDVVLQVTVPQRDFKAVVVRGAELQEQEPLNAQQQLLAFKVLTIDAERASMVKSVRGSLAFVISEAGVP